MASTSWRRCRSGDAVAWCRFGGGGLFGPDLQNDADEGQVQPDDGPRRVTAAMAQCLATENGPEDDRRRQRRRCQTPQLGSGRPS
jgi:hypothetical protein